MKFDIEHIQGVKDKLLKSSDEFRNAKALLKMCDEELMLLKAECDFSRASNDKTNRISAHISYILKARQRRSLKKHDKTIICLTAILALSAVVNVFILLCK